MVTDVEKAIREYLPEIVHMSLATISGNKPWVCELHFVYDEDLNLYFRSLASRRHSQEITANANVAGNIVKQHSVEQGVRGVYFEGTVKMITGVGKESAIYKLFQERLGADEEVLAEAEKEDGHKFYKISVSKYYLFDSLESSPSQKYELNWGNLGQ